MTEEQQFEATQKQLQKTLKEKREQREKEKQGVK